MTTFHPAWLNDARVVAAVEQNQLLVAGLRAMPSKGAMFDKKSPYADMLVAHLAHQVRKEEENARRNINAVILFLQFVGLFAAGVVKQVLFSPLADKTFPPHPHHFLLLLPPSPRLQLQLKRPNSKIVDLLSTVITNIVSISNASLSPLRSRRASFFLFGRSLELSKKCLDVLKKGKETAKGKGGSGGSGNLAEDALRLKQSLIIMSELAGGSKELRAALILHSEGNDSDNDEDKLLVPSRSAIRYVVDTMVNLLRYVYDFPLTSFLAFLRITFSSASFV